MAFAASLLLGIGLGTSALAADLTTAQIISTSASAQSDVPVTFGQVFKPGDVPVGATVGGRVGGNAVNLQVDKKATHRDGSLRHAVITAVVPSLAANGSQPLTLNNTGTAPGGGPIALIALLATSFDTTVSLNIGGTVYTASARDLLSSGTPATWLSGPLATEWLVNAPVRAGATSHPHLQARFNVRAYQGLGAVRVEVVVENAWAREAGPRNYTYNATIDVAGRGTAFSENNVEHYRQSRWRRVVWWGTTPAADVTHDGNYLAATRAVPNYDPSVQIASYQLDTFLSEFNANSGLMGIGNLQPYMPSPGGRNAIGPLPAWAAAYIMSDDRRAKRVVVGYGEQGGAWPMHYREKATDQPISIDTFPNATIIGDTNFFPACGGTCTSPYTPEASHHPSIAYLPYLLTGDYYLMEELAFWSNWVLFYGPADRHGGALGLVTWDQVRGQAWALRTLAHGAYLLPDAHPMKLYLNTKLLNNINYFITNWVDSNPLGYITNTGAAQWLGLDNWIATWMDDFLTWTFGYILGMGYTEAQPVFAWKSKFPIGRMTHSDMCSILAPSYWPYVKGDRYLGGSSAFVNNWADWKRAVILSHKDDAFRGTADITGREQELINAPCGSQQMASILGLNVGEMIGWFDHLSYLANMQPALAVAVDHGMPNAQVAFDKVWNSPNYALTDYREFPQFALWPSSATSNLPIVSINANPVSVSSGQTSTLTWSATNANSCSASGGWAGNKALSGSEPTPAITATTTFTLTCSNASGSSSAATTVTLQTAAAPTLTLSAAPTAVMSGGSSTLTWASTNATSCTASGGWTGAKATSGSQTFNNLTASVTYSLQCTGASGLSPVRSATVTVNGAPPPPPAPTVDLNASPTSVNVNGSSMLSWTSSNASSCTASGGWSGAKQVQGSESTGALSNTTSFSISCTGAGGAASDSVTVDVTPGGGGGGGTGNSDSGGGSLGWLSLAFLAGLAARRRAAAVATLSR
jgi:hypothetical protein